MRITNQMMMGSFLSDLNGNLTAVQKYENQLSSGKRIQYPSDDPMGLITALAAKEKLARLDMRTKSVQDAQSWLKQTETSLNEVNDVIEQGYGLAVQAANGTMSLGDKQATAKVIEQLRQQAVQSGNAEFGGRYIFGGYNTTSIPFTYDSSGVLQYDGVDLATAASSVTDPLKAQVIQYPTGVKTSTDVGVNGVELMGTGANNLNKVLLDFETALNNDADGTTLAGFADALTAKQDDTLALLADVGGRLNRLDMMSNSYDDDKQNYTEVFSNTVDVDVAQATIDYKVSQAVYTSALQVGAQIIQPTLLDFLK